MQNLSSSGSGDPFKETVDALINEVNKQNKKMVDLQKNHEKLELYSKKTIMTLERKIQNLNNKVEQLSNKIEQLNSKVEQSQHRLLQHELQHRK